MTGDRRDGTASEARDLVCRAIGDAAGLTVKAQLRRAAQRLGYPGDAWRLREALYRRAGGWSAAAMDELRRRYMAWREKERARVRPDALAQRLGAVRDGLAEVQRRFGELEAEVGRALGSDGASVRPKD